MSHSWSRDIWLHRDLYDVFCGVLYLLKSGCQWRTRTSPIGVLATSISGNGASGLARVASPKKNRLARSDQWTRPGLLYRQSVKNNTAGHKGLTRQEGVESSVISRWTRKDCPMRYT